MADSKTMKCHYEVLEVERNASAEDIKKNYKKMALKFHPDRNHGNVEWATEMFKTVSAAYSVLSDPQERSWYDDHRASILRGKSGTYEGEGEGDGSGSDSTEEYVVNLWTYFNNSCFNGYSDEPDGFYSVYSDLFTKIFTQELNGLNGLNGASKKAGGAPKFGVSASDPAEIQEFYSFWSNFTSNLSFSWHDKYNANEAPNRNVRRAVDKENQKHRDIAKREYNNLIQTLLKFVKKRDQRMIIIELRRIKRLEEEEKLQTELRMKENAKRREDKKLSRKMYENDEEEIIRRQGERERAYLIADSDEEEEEESSEEEDSEEGSEDEEEEEDVEDIKYGGEEEGESKDLTGEGLGDRQDSDSDSNDEDEISKDMRNLNVKGNASNSKGVRIASSSKSSIPAAARSKSKSKSSGSNAGGGSKGDSISFDGYDIDEQERRLQAFLNPISTGGESDEEVQGRAEKSTKKKKVKSEGKKKESHAKSSAAIREVNGLFAHKEEVEDTKPESLSCDICSKVFSIASQMTQHLSSRSHRNKASEIAKKNKSTSSNANKSLPKKEDTSASAIQVPAPAPAAAVRAAVLTPEEIEEVEEEARKGSGKGKNKGKGVSLKAKIGRSNVKFDDESEEDEEVEDIYVKDKTKTKANVKDTAKDKRAAKSSGEKAKEALKAALFDEDSDAEPEVKVSPVVAGLVAEEGEGSEKGGAAAAGGKKKPKRKVGLR